MTTPISPLRPRGPFVTPNQRGEYILTAEAIRWLEQLQSAVNAIDSGAGLTLPSGAYPVPAEFGVAGQVASYPESDGAGLPVPVGEYESGGGLPVPLGEY